MLSRETFLLINNILLTLSAATVLLGTLFPLLLESLDMGMISVGPPYFNALFVPMALLLVFALGFGVLLNWKSGKGQWLIQQTRWVLLVSLLVALVYSLVFASSFDVTEFSSIALTVWVVLIIAKDLRNKTRHVGFVKGLKRLKPSYFGMHLAHLGIAITMLGVAVSTQYSEQRDLRMSPGQEVTIGCLLYTSPSPRDS